MSDTPRRYETHELLEQVGWVRRLARNLVHDPGSADDLAQETLLAAIDSPPRESAGGLRAWLGTVLRNRARTKWRNDARRARRDLRAARREELPATGDVIERAETHRRLVDAVFALREPFLTTILLRYFEGLDTEQIARQQGVPQATVRSRLKRALDELRVELDDRYGSRQAWAVPILGLARMEEAATVATATGATASAASTLAGATLGGVSMSLKTVTLGLAASALIIGGAFMILPETNRDEGRGGAAPAAPSAGTAPAAENGSLGAAPAASGDAPGTAASAGQPRASTATTAASSTTLGTATGRIAGRVQSEDGRPLAGIVLHARALPQVEDFEGAFQVSFPGDFDFPAIDSEEQRADSSQRGEFAIAGLAPGRYGLIARGQGKRQKIVRKIDVRPGAEAPVDLTMLEGFSIEGTVVDPSGNPVSGAAVRAEVGMIALAEGGLSFRMEAPGMTVETGPIETESDGRGRFLLEGLAPGNHSVRAEHAQWARAYASEVAAGSRDVELRMAKGGSISGHVVGPAGESVAGAKVSASEWFGEDDADATTDSAGSFRIDHVAAGKSRLVVIAEGYPAKHVPGIEVQDGEETQGIRVTLEAGAVIAGKVVDAAGVAIAEAAVAIGSTSREFFIPTHHAKTDEAGRFRISGVKAGTQLRGHARHPGYLTGKIAEFTAEAGEQELPRIALGAGASVAGRVLDEDGNPIAGAGVELSKQHSMAGGVIKEAIELELFEGGEPMLPGKRAVSAHDGTYRIAAIDAGNYSLKARADGYAAFRGEPFQIQEDAAVEGRDVVLARGLAIHGTVVSRSGVPVAGAKVTATQGSPGFMHDHWLAPGADPKGLIEEIEDGALARFGGRPHTTTTDADGHFEIAGLESGQHSVTATADGFGSTRLTEIAAGGGAVQVTLESSGSLAGVVLDAATGDPVRDFSLKVGKRSVPILEDALHSLEISNFDFFGQGEHFQSPDGRFQKAELAAGSYDVEVRAKGFSLFEAKNVAIVAGEEQLLEVRLEPGGSIEGQVVNHRGEPIEGATVARATEEEAGGTMRMVMAVAVTDDSDGESITMELGSGDSVRTDKEGKFLIEGLPEGTIDLKVSHKDYMDHTVEGVDVARRRVKNVGRVTLEKGGTIFGTVNNAAGKSVHIMIMKETEQGFPGGMPRMVNVDRSGNYSQSGLAPGRYSLHVQRIDSDEGMGGVFVAGGTGGQQATLDLGAEESVRRDFTLD
ncbi:MAG: sigma-70 family RNA polymerase sigma factor [Planctomycetes bacterium]|nr:sigma-70 family RNA polymerase sigma factor [Planctomycetota bacterium]